MNIEVLLSSGESDTFRGAADTIVEDHYLHVIKHIDGDEIPDGMKTVVLKKEIEHTMAFLQSYTGSIPVDEFPKPTKSETLEVVATYAPGMWMKVVYNQ